MVMSIFFHHYQLHGIERVGPEVVDEDRPPVDLILGYHLFVMISITLFHGHGDLGLLAAESSERQRPPPAFLFSFCPIPPRLLTHGGTSWPARRACHRPSALHKDDPS